MRNDMIEFVQGDLSIQLCRSAYRLVNQNEERSQDDSDIKALELYIGYDDADEWGSIGDNYVNLSDVMKLKRGLESVADGIERRFELSINTIYGNSEWMKFLCERTEVGYHFRFEWRELTFNELYVIDQEYSREEWQPYLERFLLWGEIFPVELGDRVIGIDPDEEHFTLGTEGWIDTIYPKDERDTELRVVVSYMDEGWNGPYMAGKVLGINQLKVLR